MKTLSDIENLIIDMSDDPSLLDSRFEDLVVLIRGKKSIDEDILSDKELTKLVKDVAKGGDPKKLKDHLAELMKAVKKSFIEKEPTFAVNVDIDPKKVAEKSINEPKDESFSEKLILLDQPNRKIITTKLFGYVVDKIGNRFSVKSYNTYNNFTDMTKWKLLGKKLATRESLAELIK